MKENIELLKEFGVEIPLDGRLAKQAYCTPVNKKALRVVDKNLETFNIKGNTTTKREKVLMVLYNVKGLTEATATPLCKEILRENFGKESSTIIRQLTTLGLVHTNGSYSADFGKCKMYYAEYDKTVSTVTVELKSKWAIKRMKKIEYNMIMNKKIEGQDNLDILYTKSIEADNAIKYPTDKEISEKLSTLVGKPNGKGGVYVGKGRKKEQDTYVRDIKTSWGYNKDSRITMSQIRGNRIYSKLQLAPKVIRSMFTIDGEHLVECDFNSFHVAIALSKFATQDEIERIGLHRGVDLHQEVADFLGIERREAKLLQLTFLNGEVWQNKASKLYDYFNVIAPNFLKNIIEYKTKYGHNRVYHNVLEYTEGLVMRGALRLLGNTPIVSVHDALYCKESDVDLVKESMVASANHYGVQTTIG